MRRMVTAACVMVFGVGASAASGQAINVEFGLAGSTPSAAYGAAGLAGHWNTFQVLPSSNTPLMGLDGQPAGATIRNIGGTQMLSVDDGLTSGDDEALLDDMLIGFNDPVDVCIWFGGLDSGTYEVLIYGMTPGDAGLLSRLRVDFADHGPDMVGGAWGGQHQLGVTYSRHTVNVTSGGIGLHSGLFGGNIQSGINGIQIRPLPAVCDGDVTGDFRVNFDDINEVLGDFGGQYDFDDLNEVLASFDTICE